MGLRISSLIVCSTVLLGSALGQGPVHFPDPNLKSAVEDALWVYDPTPADMLGLGKLSCFNRGVTDITGLEYAENLQSLNLHLNQISDISPLSGLDNMQKLDLSRNQIKDLSALSDMSGLHDLNLHGNRISNISVLAEFADLENLVLRLNQITDISALSGLTKLTRLLLNENQISDISALSGLTNLTTLYLYDNQISDISALSGLTDLTRHYLHNNQISDVSPLSGLTSLTTLYLYRNQISDISPLSGLTNLSVLWLHDNPLNQEACDTHIPQIVADNSGSMELRYDPCITQHPLEEEIRPALKIHVDDNGVNDPGPNDLSISDPQEDGTQDHPYDSIQEAIEQAQDLDTILVHEGRYYERLNLLSKNTEIRRFVPDASDIATYPVIDAQNDGTVVTFNQGEDPGCVLAGFVLTGGLHGNSAAIACIGASPTIKNCLIVGNRSTDPLGAIIYCEGSHSLFENLTVGANSSGESGSAFRFIDCDVTVTNSILWGNAPSEITVAAGNDPTIVYSDVQGTWPGLGNVATDPLFALPSHEVGPNHPNAVLIPGDYHVLSETGRWNPDSLTWVADELTSPCIDAGDPGSLWTDEARPHGARINMGAYGGTDQASCSLRVMPFVALWTFDESSGDTAYDSAGDNHGTVHGAIWTEGILDGALQFDGVDDYVDCGNDPALAPDLFSLSMWIYAQTTSGSRTILRKAGSDKDKDYEFELFAAQHPTFSFGNGAQNAVLYSNSLVPLDEWTQMTLTRAETEATVYINGTQLMSKPFDFAPSVTDHDLIIGGGSQQAYKGRIDDVQIYDSVLSAEYIKNLVREVGL